MLKRPQSNHDLCIWLKFFSFETITNGVWYAGVENAIVVRRTENIEGKSSSSRDTISIHQSIQIHLPCFTRIRASSALHALHVEISISFEIFRCP